MTKYSLSNIKLFFDKNFHLLTFIYFFFLLFSSYQPTLEPFEYGAIRKIYNPELKGNLVYDPQFHFNYFFYFIISFFENYSYENKINITTYIFWFYDRFLTLILLYSLCKILFKNKNYQLFAIILSTTFIINDSMQVDQKSFLFPFFLLSLIFILKEKYILSGFFTALIFYFHVGWGFWWLIPSSFALFFSFFFINNFKIIFFYKYFISAIFFSSPIILYYINLNLNTSEFTVTYEYYSHYYFLSAFYFFKLNVEPWTYIKIFFFFIIPFICIFKFSEYTDKFKEFLLIIFGIFFTFFLSLIFADFLRIEQAIRIFLMRSTDVYYFFHYFFLSFIIFYYLNKKNPIPFILFLICYTALKYSFFISLLSEFNLNNYDINKFLINFFYIYLLISELILFLLKYSNNKTFKIHFILIKFFNVLSKNITVYALLILIAITTNQNIKLFIKKIINYPIYYNEISERHKVIDHINKNIIDFDSIFIIPFSDIDMEYYLDKKVFLTEFSIHDVRYNNKNISDIESIITNEFNLSIEDIFFNDKTFDPQKVNETWLNLWLNLNINDIKKIKDKYGATHLLRETHLPINLKIVYQNSKYVIYDLTNL